MEPSKRLGNYAQLRRGKYQKVSTRKAVDTSQCNNPYQWAVDEAVKRRRPYKKISLEHKLAVVRATFEPGMSVSRVARRFDVKANLVFRWRKMYADEATWPLAPTNFVPVEIVKPVSVPHVNSGEHAH